jgi:phosphoglycolate phosphatase
MSRPPPVVRISGACSGVSVCRVEFQPGFRWDGCDAYLFDIDGTLLRAQGSVHFDAFSSSVFEVLGQRLSLRGVPIHGNTDTGILRAAFRQAAIAEEVWQPRLEEILQRMRSTVHERREAMDIVVQPGVLETLAYLKSRGKTLGVATGNLEQIGWLKIEIAGLRQWFSFGGFSDRHVDRAALIGQAAAEGRRLAGKQATVCVVGDTPSDIAAARANSLPVIAVATGNFSFGELWMQAPEVCAANLPALLEFVSIG